MQLDPTGDGFILPADKPSSLRWLALAGSAFCHVALVCIIAHARFQIDQPAPSMLEIGLEYLTEGVGEGPGDHPGQGATQGMVTIQKPQSPLSSRDHIPPKLAVATPKRPSNSNPSKPAKKEQSDIERGTESTGPAQEHTSATVESEAPNGYPQAGGAGIGSGESANSTQGSSGGGKGDGAPVQMAFGVANGPRFLRQIKPEYPFTARRRGQEGRVILRLTINKEGQLLGLKIVESAGTVFDNAALEAVRASIYAPAMRNGQPLDSIADLIISFRLDN